MPSHDSHDLTHLTTEGQVMMVDVTAKPATFRQARAHGYLSMQLETLHRVEAGQGPKGNVIETARIAGIMAAKRTSELVPLCHPLPLTSIDVVIQPDLDLPGYRIEATVKTTSQTGVEMEALTAVSVAALTLYDMTKALEKTLLMGGIHLVFKEGGKSGSFHSTTTDS